jgi:hypothetical protein
MNTYEVHLFGSSIVDLVTASFFEITSGNALVFWHSENRVTAFAPGVWKLVVKQEVK